MKFLGSMDCEKLIGQQGVVFPAIPAAAELSKAAHAKQGVDVTPFLDEATPDGTFLYPVTTHGSEVLSIINPALDKIFLGTDPIAPILKDANDQIKALDERHANPPPVFTRPAAAPIRSSSHAAKPKIAFIGAGSTVFAKNLMGDIFSNPDLSDAGSFSTTFIPLRLKHPRLSATVSSSNSVSRQRDGDYRPRARA